MSGWMDALTVISGALGVASLALAIYTIWLQHLSEQRVQGLFDKTQAMLAQHFDRVKDLLSEVDKRSLLIEKTVTDSQQSMLQTLTTIVNEAVIPKKVNINEQFAAMMMQSLLDDPAKAGKAIDKMLPLIELGQKMGKSSNGSGIS